MDTKNFRMRGFFGGTPFGRCNEVLGEKWSKMTEDEKKAFIEEQVNFINESFADEDTPFLKRGKITIEDMDKRCEEWQKRSVEEKEKFVKQRNKRMELFLYHRGCGHHGFGFRGY